MKNISFSHIRLDFRFVRATQAAGLLALLAAALLTVGCANPTAISRETTFQPNEGAVVMRMINISSAQNLQIQVTAEGSKEKFFLSATAFGQTGSTTFVGRLPSGRYQPSMLYGMQVLSRIEAPLEKLTGKFDVEASRVTDLGTMVYLPDASSVDEGTNSRQTKFLFSLPLDPTPVPTEQLLAVRFPAIAAAVKGRSNLGWVEGTVPRQPTGVLNMAARRASMKGTPVFLGKGQSVAAGQLGTVVERGPEPRSWKFVRTGVVQQLEAILRLKDGRWMVGGEEGYLAMADSLQGQWSRLPGLAQNEVVVSLLQGPDGSIYMLTMNDAGSTVYQSAPDTINWKVIRRIEGDRSKSIWRFDRARNSAAMSKDRLVIYTLPNTISSMDFRTGQWESHETPRPFATDIKVTPDGRISGVFSAPYTYGSDDHGKTWRRQEFWLTASQGDFSDRNKGIMISATGGVLASKFFVRKTIDGGQSWSAVHEVKDALGWTDVPIWIDRLDESGKSMYAMRYGRVYNSADMGVTWN